MPLQLEDIAFLRSVRARAILHDYAESDVSAENTLALLTDLRKSMSRSEASAILTTLRLRHKARGKFGRDADVMLFTDAGLQQASHPLVRAYRSRAFEAASVLDLCCGIGSDSLAFAASSRRALGLDIDELRIAIARHNAEVLKSRAQYAVADVRRGLPAGYDCLFFDPARRDAAGRRIHHVERYIPPLSLVREWGTREICVKLSPALDLRQISRYGGQVEFVSVDGQLTEAMLWLHWPSARPAATLLTGTARHHLWAGREADVEIAAPRTWLFEPDPAVLRAGLVRHLAADLHAAMLDSAIAYLTLDERRDTVWGRYWKIRDWMPFQLKRLRRYFAQNGVGRVTVKKRGFPQPPEEIIRQLRLKDGDESRVLVLTRHRGAPIAIICDEPSFG